MRRSSAARWTTSARPPARAHVPLLRKDFILDELQILEARAAGASAVLLIVRALPPARLAALLAQATASRPRRAGRGPYAAGAGPRARRGRADPRREQPRPRHLPHRHGRGLGAPRVRARRRSSRSRRAAWPAPSDVEAAAAAGADAVLIGTALSAGGRSRRAARAPEPDHPPWPLRAGTRGQDLRAHAPERRGGRRRAPGRPTWASFLLVGHGVSPSRVRPPSPRGRRAASRSSASSATNRSRRSCGSAAAAGLAGAQLHGAYRREDAGAAPGRRPARLARGADRGARPISTRLAEAARDADAVLVEPRVPHAAGGAGVSLDLAVAREARARLAGRDDGAGRRAPPGHRRRRRGPRSTRGRGCKFRGGAPAGHQGPRQNRALSGGGVWP